MDDAPGKPEYVVGIVNEEVPAYAGIAKYAYSSSTDISKRLFFCIGKPNVNYILNNIIPNI